MTLLVVNVLALDAVLLVLGAITAAAYRRLRSRPAAFTLPDTFTAPTYARFDPDAYAAPRPDGEEPTW